MNDNEEFTSIIKDITENNEFLKLKKITHHGLNRYDHCLRVSYYSYNVTRFLKLDYYKTTRAAMLHDFFFNENENINLKEKTNNLRKHPTYALENASKNFYLSEKEEDIILTHMFPVSLNPPKYIESWIVDVVDDVVAVYEKCYGLRKQLSFASSFIMIFILNYIK